MGVDPAEIAAEYDAGATIDELVATHGQPRSTIAAMIQRHTEPRPVGRRPSQAVTPRTARGAAALAQLVTDADAAGETVEVYLETARRLREI